VPKINKRGNIDRWPVIAIVIANLEDVVVAFRLVMPAGWKASESAMMLQGEE